MDKHPFPDDFQDPHRHGFVLVATATPEERLADVAFNTDAIIEQARRAAARNVDLLVFPELCVSSYAIDDLHLQSALPGAVEEAVVPQARVRMVEKRKGMCVWTAGDAITLRVVASSPSTPD